MSRLLWLLAWLLCGCAGLPVSSQAAPTAAYADAITSVPAATALPAPTPQQAPATAPPADVQLDQPFNLSPGQAAHLGDADVQVVLAGVSDDSRCPVGVACVWSGVATVSGTLAEAGVEQGQFSLVIGGGDTLTEGSIAQVGRYQIDIQSLTPTPQANAPIAAHAYSATLTVSLVR